MNRYIAVITATIASLVLLGCASTPKVALSPEKKQSIKRIAVVEIPEPEKYVVNPGQLQGGQVFSMFGALGGAILGGIESSRIDAASNRFTAAVSPLNPALSNSLTAGLERGLQAKGYEVIKIVQPPKQKDGKEYDLSKVEGSPDAILIPALTAGYSAEGKTVAPRVTLALALYSKSNSEKLFSDFYIYGTQSLAQGTRIEPHTEFRLASIDALYTDIHLSVNGLKKGVNTLVERAVSDL